jgi:hypothetical protein
MALSSVLAPAFHSRDVPLLGLSLTSDLAKLAASCPEVDAFNSARCCLELKRLWRLAAAAADAPGNSSGASGGRGGGKARGRNQVGLSFLAGQVLGKPLDKAMQARASWTLDALRLLRHRAFLVCSL